MKIYSFLPRDENIILNAVEKNDSTIIINNLSCGNYEKLKPESVVLESLDNVPERELPDIPWLYPEGLLCREKAFNLFGSFLNGCGAWNVMKYNEESVFYFSVTNELDALDERLTDFIEHDGFILGANKYVFKNIDYKDYPIFRMKSLKGHYPVVTEQFVEFVNSHKLSGLEFKELGSALG